MFWERLYKIPKGTLKVTLFILLGVALAAFALTQTQLGRDGLSRQLQAQFNRTFEGRLAIGTLQGNLFNDLFARHVTVYAPNGRPVLHVDSMVVKASWLDLFSQSVTLRQVTFFRPHLKLHRGPEGPWNLTQAFTRRQPRAEAPNPWMLAGASAEVRDGTLTVRNEGPVPQAVADGLVYDVTNTELTRLHSRFSIDWQPNQKLIDVLALTAQVPALGLPLEQVQGQWALHDATMALQAFHVETGQSRFDVNLQMDHTPEAGLNLTDLRILQSTISPEDWRALLPGISYPFMAETRFSARLQGKLDNLTLNRLDLTTGGSRLRAEGSVQGLPDSARFHFNLDAPAVRAADFRRAPTDDPRWADLPEADVQATSTGTIQFRETGRAWTTAHTLALQHPGGSIMGTLRVDQPPDHRLQYEADLAFEGVDLAQWPAGQAPNTRLNGRLQGRGTGLTLDSLRADAVLRLGAARWGTHPIDSLHLAVNWTGRQGEVDLRYTYGPQSLSTDAQIDLRGAHPTFAGQTRLNSFDPFPWLPANADALVRTASLSGAMQFDGSGASLDALRGEARFLLAPSRLTIGGDTTHLPAAAHVLNINRPQPHQTALTLNGDWIDADVQGRFTFDALRQTAQLWGLALDRTLKQIEQKPYGVDFGPVAVDSAAIATLNGRQARLSEQLQLQGLTGSMHLNGRVHLKNAAWLAPWARAWTGVFEGSEATIGGTIDPQALALNLALQTDTLLTVQGTLAPVHATLNLNSAFAPTLTNLLQADALVESSAVRLRGRSFQGVRARAHMNDGEGRLSIASAPDSTQDALSLEALFAFLPDRNRVTLNQAIWQTSEFTWTAQGEPRIDLYQDAVVLTDVLVEGFPVRAPEQEERQRLRLSGTLSDRPGDAVVLAAENIRLDEWSGVAGLQYPLGGNLNAAVTLTGGLTQPEFQGQINVLSLSLNNRNLGTFQLASRYDPAEAGRLSIEAVVAQPDPATDMIQDNDVRIAGTLRLPGLRASGVDRNPGALDLTVQAQRLDLFFFDYIFKFLDQSQGYAAGSGTIQGTFDRPLFNASFEAYEGSVTLPEFNLKYHVAGPFRIDQVGFHLNQVEVRDKTGGTAEVTGRILFNDYKFFSFDLSGVLDEFQVIDVDNSPDLPFYGHIWASGTASLTGPLYNAMLRSSDAVTSTRSELFIPILAVSTQSDETFITFVDSTTVERRAPTRRRNVLASRPRGERSFLDGLNMNLNISAPPGSTVHLVFDPLLGDVMNAVGQGRVQFQRQGGEYATFGTFTVESGDYLFTAQDVFARRFLLEPGGTITWDGDPLDPLLAIPASYRTRASLAGLPVDNPNQRVPMVIGMTLTNRITSPLVALNLRIDRDEHSFQQVPELLETVVNQPDRSAEYATSVLLTNSFLLTTTQAPDFAGAANQLFFTSLSQLVASQFNRFANEAFNLDLNFGVQQNELEALDLTYGFALRLQEERLIIRGEGIYEGGQQTDDRLRGALVIEYQLTPNVLVEAFYRREDDFLESSSVIGTSYGAGLVYQTEFATWGQFKRRVRGTVEEDEMPPALKEDPVPPAE